MHVALRVYFLHNKERSCAENVVLMSAMPPTKTNLVKFQDIWRAFPLESEVGFKLFVSEYNIICTQDGA